MKKIKKLAIVGVATVMLAATSATAFAAIQNRTPADIVADITGKDVQSVIDEKNKTGEAYGSMAKEAGKLDEFKTKMVESKEETLKNKVKDGTITQAQADETLNRIKDRQANCNGTGNMKGQGQGQGFGKMGMRNGSCIQ